MTFAITTKSGRSVNIKADNYKEAQKYADRHFGKGCIVQLVGNTATTCDKHPASSNAIVNAALAWKEKTAANAKFKVGDYVLYEGHGEGYRRGRIVSLGGTIGSAGCVVEWVGGGRDSVPYTRLTPCNSATTDSAVAANGGIDDYHDLYRELRSIIGTGMHGEFRDDGTCPYIWIPFTSKFPSKSKVERLVWPLCKKHHFGAAFQFDKDGAVVYVNSAGADIDHRIAANAVVSNAGRKTVKVELETVSFEKGVRSETRYMSIEEVRDLLKRLGKSGDADSFVSRLERQGASDIAINAPDLYAALI